MVNVKITASGIKEFLNQPHEHYFEKNELVKDLSSLLHNAEYLGFMEYHKANDNIVATHVFKCRISSANSYLLAREDLSGEINFYSISDSETIVKHIKQK